jgi:hypothetical protein
VVGFASQRLDTGGAVSPDGRRIALRTYTDAYLYDVPGDDLVEAFDEDPVVVALPESKQGEAITWTRDSRSLVVTGEGARARVSRVVPPAAPRAAVPKPTKPTTTGPSAPTAQPEERNTSLPLAAGAATVVVLLPLLLLRRRRRRRRRL